MRPLTGGLAILFLSGCAMLPTDGIYVHEPPGVSQATLAADKAACYRASQPGEPAPFSAGSALPATGLVAGTALAATGSPRAGGAVAGAGSAVGMLEMMILTERADAARRPPDPEKYRACLLERGYWLD